jgi:hypothetical protein
MPASPPAGIEVSGLSTATEGWFIEYPDGTSYEIACWGLLLDNTGVVPLIFDQAFGKLLPPGTGYILVHSHWPDQSVTLADTTEPGTGPEVNLGGLYSRKSSLVTSSPGSVFSAQIEGSIDGETWFEFGGELTGDGVQSEVMLTIHYARVRIDSITGGPVEIKLSWS